MDQRTRLLPVVMTGLQPTNKKWENTQIWEMSNRLRDNKPCVSIHGSNNSPRMISNNNHYRKFPLYDHQTLCQHSVYNASNLVSPTEVWQINKNIRSGIVADWALLNSGSDEDTQLTWKVWLTKEMPWFRRRKARPKLPKQEHKTSPSQLLSKLRDKP